MEKTAFFEKNEVIKPQLEVDVGTLFPEILNGAFTTSILGRAQVEGLVRLQGLQLRDYGLGRHRQVDDAPYGGGAGMVMRPEPFFEFIDQYRRPETKVLMMTPQGKRFDQTVAHRLSKEKHLIFLCGHYEGVDHRVVENLVDEELSLGDYVLTNGAIAALVMVDAIVRLVPGVLGDADSSEYESFGNASGEGRNLLEAPQYTRPANYRGHQVPDILLSGNHGAVAQWRREEALRRTHENRPDLLTKNS